MTLYCLIFFKFRAQPAYFVMFILGRNGSELGFQATLGMIKPGYIATCW